MPVQIPCHYDNLTLSSLTQIGSFRPFAGVKTAEPSLNNSSLTSRSNSKYWPRQKDLNLLLTYSMVQSHSWAANWFAASQEITRISRNPKVHYHTHKRPPPLSILSQPNPVHIPTSHILEIHPNIIHPSTPRSTQWSLSLRFPHLPSPHPYAPHAQPISFYSILSPAQYWVSSTNHLAPRYAISSIPPLPRPS